MITVLSTDHNKRIFFIVNVDWFFLSHRLLLAIAMKEKGYEVFVLTKDSGRKAEIEAYGLHFIEVKFNRSGRNLFKEIRIVRKLIRLFKTYSPDIIHNVTIKPAIYSSIALKFYKKEPLKFINAISGLGYNFIKEKKGITQRILKKAMRFAYKGSINFIFQNPDDKLLYEKMGFLHNNYKIIKGSGVDSKNFSYTPPTNKEKVTVIFLARMLRDKGVLEFIHAANILQQKFQHKARFFLVGDIDDGNLASLKSEEIRALEIPGYIEWKGFTRDAKSAFINSDIACLPSYREGLPKSLIEAMAVGRPIVTTDVPGCRECVDEGENGFLVPAKDAVALAEAIEKLLINPELRLRMGRASREKMVKELSLKQVIKETLEYYDQI